MIFVTVGTHEQQFNRLVKYVDDMRKDGLITEEVIIQTGYSTYEPRYCTWQKLYPYQVMTEYVNEARIVITHGGPSSFIMPLQIGKTPIVVPRQKKYDEHVNNHQLEFCREVAIRHKNIINIEEIEQLGKAILKYEVIVSGIANIQVSNNEKFCMEFSKIVDGFF